MFIEIKPPLRYLITRSNKGPEVVTALAVLSLLRFGSVSVSSRRVNEPAPSRRNAMSRWRESDWSAWGRVG